MSKLYYLIAATIRVIIPYLSRFSAAANKLMQYLVARSQTGITARLWMAVLMSVAALLVNVFYIDPAYDSLPAIVPIEFNADGEIDVWGHKTILDDYAEVRIVFFLSMLFIGWVISKAKGNTLMGQRMGLLVVDIANLIITTGISMTLVYIEIAHGDTTQKLSEYWEYSVMLFWILILIIEYATDKKHIK